MRLPDIEKEAHQNKLRGSLIGGAVGDALLSGMILCFFIAHRHENRAAHNSHFAAALPVCQNTSVGFPAANDAPSSMFFRRLYALPEFRVAADAGEVEHDVGDELVFLIDELEAAVQISAGQLTDVDDADALILPRQPL